MRNKSYEVISTYDDDGHEMRVREVICYTLETAEIAADMVREFRADQTYGPTVTIEEKP